MLLIREFHLSYLSFEFSLSIVVLFLHPLDSGHSKIALHWCGYESGQRDESSETDLPHHPYSRLHRTLCFKLP